MLDFPLIYSFCKKPNILDRNSKYPKLYTPFYTQGSFLWEDSDERNYQIVL